MPAPVGEPSKRVGASRARPRSGFFVAGSQRVAKVPQGSPALGALGFLVRQCRQAARAPVDDILAAIDEVVLVEPHEDLPDRPRQALVEGEAGPRPVAAASDRLELPENAVAGRFDVFPHAPHERFAAQIVPRPSLGGKAPLDDVLGGDAGVVGSRHPQRDPSLHPPPTDEHVLDRVVEAVPHVKDRGDVRRRDHDHVGIAPLLDCARRRPEMAAVLPHAQDSGFDRPGVEGLGQHGGLQPIAASARRMSYRA